LKKHGIENGTAVTLTVGDAVIPATLNDNKAAQDLISRLPYTITLHRYEYDYCGVMDNPLEYDKKDEHNGWKNGDIDFAVVGNYFSILFDGEEVSESYSNMITLGRIDEDLSVIKSLGNTIGITVALSE
jgi:hypothetical protein